MDNGVWLSLVERIVRDDEVAGSNPVTPTIETNTVCIRFFGFIGNSVTIQRTIRKIALALNSYF